MAERKNNKKCHELIKEGKALLNQLWREIPPHKKYLKCDFIADQSFKNIRWKIASLTLKLKKYAPSNKRVIAPSVMANTKQKVVVKDDAYYIKKGLASKSIEYVDLAKNNFAGWKPTSNKELHYTVKNGIANLAILTNYKNGLGYPYIQYQLGNKGIHLSDYEFLYVKIKFTSNRDAVANDVTKLGFVFKNSNGEKWAKPDLGGNEGVWKTLQIPLNDPVFQKATKLLILPKEAFYPDKTKITFSISEIGLLKFKSPMIKEMVAVDTLLDSDTQLPVRLTGYNFKKGEQDGVLCKFTLKDETGKVVAEMSAPLKENLSSALLLKTLTPGKYTLTAELFDKTGESCSKQSKKEIEVIKGL